MRRVLPRSLVCKAVLILSRAPLYCIISRLRRSGVITLDALRRSDFTASLNAVSRHEIGLEVRNNFKIA